MGAIADADRRLRARGAVGFVISGDEVDATGVDVVDVVGGESGWSGLGVARPLLCADGGLEDLLEDEESF